MDMDSSNTPNLHTKLNGALSLSLSIDLSVRYYESSIKTV